MKIKITFFALLLLPLCAEEKVHHPFPQWLSRIDFEADIRHPKKPTWYVETIQPLYRTHGTKRHTFFFQGRVAHKASDETFNMGLGYRFLFPNETWMLGINSFYDITRKHTHQRWSVGGELFNPYVVVRGNYYQRITGTKTVRRIGGVSYTQRALTGWDVEGQLPFPFFPWLRATCSYFKWYGDKMKDKKGIQATALLDICDYLSLELGWNHMSHYRDERFLLLTFHFGRPKRIEFTLFKNPYYKGFKPRSLKNLTLEKVRRKNDIILEKRETGSDGVIVGRGT